MDLFTIIGVCLRRWYVTLPLVAAATYMAFVAYEAVPSVYSSSVSIVVLPGATPQVDPDDLEVPVVENPYSGSGGPRFAAAVLERNMNTSWYSERAGLGDVEDIGYLATAASQQPIIRIDATGPTPEAVLGALDALTAEAGVVLAEFQTTAGSPVESQFRIAPAVPADKVTDVTPSRFRSAGAIMVLGLALAAAAATVMDSALRRRRERPGQALGTLTIDPAAEAASEEPPASDDSVADRSDAAALATEQQHPQGTASAPSPRPGDDRLRTDGSDRDPHGRGRAGGVEQDEPVKGQGAELRRNRASTDEADPASWEPEDDRGEAPVPARGR